MPVRLFIGLVAMMLLPTISVHAAVYCATNENELRAAFAAIGSTFSTENNEIRLTRRVFFNGTQVFGGNVSGPSGALVISGGWGTAGVSACDTQIVDARLTVIDAQSASAILSIQRSSAFVGATPLIALGNMTLRNGNAASAPVGAYISNSFGSIEVDNVIVHGNRATASSYLGGVALTLDASSQDIELRNSLIYDNEGVFIAGGALANVLFTSLSLNPNRNWYATNNTIVAGPDTTAEAIRMQSDGNFWVINNVLRGAVRYASSITGAGAATPPQLRQLFNNFPTAPITAGIVVVSNLSNTFVDPKLDPVTYAPLPTSPMVNAGLGSPPGGVPALDVYGQPRVFGTFIDVGAVELQSIPPVLPPTVQSAVSRKTHGSAGTFNLPLSVGP